MVKSFLTRIFGTFQSRQEVVKYGLLGVTFGLLIAAYWGLRPLKDGIFQGIVGADYQPYAKMLSLVVIFLLIGIYAKLVDLLARNQVFYVLSAAFTLGAFLFAFLLSHPQYGIANTVESPARLLGWAWYIYVESIGTLMVPLFWAFAADVSTEDSAKRGFPLIMLCAQFGNIAGPWFLRAKWLGFSNSAPVVAVAGCLLALVGVFVWIFMRVTPASEFHAPAEHTGPEEEKTGFLEGLRLLVTNTYLLGIFVFLLAFEAVATIIDFYFKLQVKAAFADEMMRSNYLAMFAVITGLLSFFSIVFGIGNVQRKLGMRASLVTLPVLMMIGMVVWWMNPVLLVSGAVVVFFKGLNYALNQPAIKQLYIPTSKDTRYKAQAWIEVFGGRGSKALGSTINALKLPLGSYFGSATGLSIYLGIASVASLSVLVAWVFVAIAVSATYNKAVKEKKVVC